ncbi:NRDE family protein [Mucilaginibacter ginsenosidivorans]
MELMDEMLTEVRVPEYKVIDFMCNVTFLKNKYSTILTSDWDGNVERGYALPPLTTTRNNKKIMFTRDEKTGGSWFAASEEGHVAVMIHQESDLTRKENKLKSSSLLLLDIVCSDFPISFFTEYDLRYFEPFSLILYAGDKLYDMTWDNGEKTILDLEISEEHIWSSMPAYYRHYSTGKKEEFKNFLVKKPKPYASAIRTFHKELCQAPSVTQAVVMHNSVMFYHTDVLEDKFYISSLPLKNRPFLLND